MFDDQSRKRRVRRQIRVRKKVRGTAERPRMTVFRSAKHIYVQVISDESGTTLASASTMQSKGQGGNVAAAKRIGEAVAKKCLEQSISRVVFDRNGFLYHGRVKALADAAREAGLEF